MSQENPYIVDREDETAIAAATVVCARAANGKFGREQGILMSEYSMRAMRTHYVSMAASMVGVLVHIEKTHVTRLPYLIWLQKVRDHASV